MMRRALFHAERALGATTPNPTVGAVVVDTDGIVVGQGFHERAGGPHAEVVALGAAGERARGGTLFVTLEPCCHTGRTGPCTDRILAAGIARVVAATGDPFPAVSGRGFAVLRAAGLRVDVGLEGDAARRLVAGYLLVHEHGRPHVIVKAATSRDRRIARHPGAPTAISGAASRRRSQRLRAGVDAIAVGIGTVLADDPQLTCRDVVRDRQLTRVVFDRGLRMPPTARLLSDRTVGPLFVVTGPEGGAPQGAAARLADAGATLIRASSIEAALTALAARGIHTLLVEGGAQLHRAFWEAKLVDRVHLVVAPCTLGTAGVPLFGGLDVPWSQLSRVQAVRYGDDVWMEADVHWHH
jgi:diaminohydroxyphosphoribosylaminopyrimidine deaminase / 5-amino-6-(5-phosphoribosylamino)uracil reductase